MPRFFVDIEARFAQFQDTLDKVVKQTANAAGRMEDAFKGVRSVLGSLGVGISVTAFATAIVREAKEAEQASSRLTAVLRATGASAGIAKGELDDMAESLAAATQFDDDAVRNAQSALLKFGNIQGNVFKEGLKLSADLAAFMGTDIPEAAQMIGKSLQSPTEGLTLMERQFGKLTDAEEKNIAELVKQGRAVDAQNAVLDLWRGKIGGTAELMNTGLTKATRDVTKAWNDMLESIGRTETVGFLADSILGSIAKTLRDIERLAKPSPLASLERDLRLLNDEIERIERSRPRTGRSPLIDERLAELKAQQQAVQDTLAAAQSKQVDPFAFDPKSLDITLGGKTDDKAERDREQREAEFRAQKAVELDEMATEDRIGASEALKNVAIQNEKERQQAIKETTDKIVESAELEQGRIDGLVFTYDRFGNKIELLKEDFELLEEQQKKNNQWARDLGLTFTSAFEDAILRGKEFSDVLLGIAQDIARLVIRRQITEPLGAGLDAFFRGIFSGASGGSGGGEIATATGGRRDAGQLLLVGEQGPELFVPDSAGTVVPNDKLGGGSVINQTNHFHGISSAGVRNEVLQMLPQITEASRRGVKEAHARGR